MGVGPSPYYQLINTKMPTFEEAYSAVLDEARKPVDDEIVLRRAKREIRNAVRYCNRSYPFKVTEAITEYPFPGNTDTVTYGAIETNANLNQTTVLAIRYIELLGATGDSVGFPIEIFDSAQLHHDRRRWLNKQPADLEYDLFDYRGDQGNYETFVSRNRKFSAFVVGKSLGLFPRPGSTQILKLLYHKEFAPLVEDSDTNDLLDFAYDYVILRALRRFLMLEQESERPLLTFSELTESWNELQAADKIVMTGHPVT